MKETQTYKLNQWELTDLIRMDDFNANDRATPPATTARWPPSWAGPRSSWRIHPPMPLTG